MTHLEVKDLAPAFGAEIIGFDPKAPLDDETRTLLRHAFDTRGLLRFRDIDLTHAEQVALSRMLIRKEGLAEDGETPPEDKFYVSNRRPDSAAPFGRLQFHSDTMWCEQPFEVLSLYGAQVEQPSAPTTFVSAVHAWKTLPDALRKQIEGLEVLHTAGVVRRGDLSEVLVTEVVNPPTAITKLGMRHPRTGETVLYACEQMTREIVGLSHEESEAILEQVFDHLYAPTAQWDHEWREGDFVVWDNIAMQHSRKTVTVEGPTRHLRKAASPMPKLRPDQRPVYSAPAQ
ncbi:Taurine dioxygenase, alpha-ketoglutarate-dependent [Novosphingobium sp. CF614]|uniref:TauD/TfdA dioxygenase family protein n=1 Tax=Novosphingobium sp. CF614 TaxID=1884364 RepID=UPI0008F09D80|nr:TauD/TfdA family dioxygenase [Novosphingobium sp. CF614]SFF77298.1 Taurine dioxygenase, alpha-ketoglutarate-dependent [Novosphingobium sp. CF614]